MTATLAFQLPCICVRNMSLVTKLQCFVADMTHSSGTGGSRGLKRDSGEIQRNGEVPRRRMLVTFVLVCMK